VRRSLGVLARPLAARRSGRWPAQAGSRGSARRSLRAGGLEPPARPKRTLGFRKTDPGVNILSLNHSAPATPISFVEVEKVLTDVGSMTAPGEAHGIICGRLCAEGASADPRWMAHILGDEPRAEAVGRCDAVLHALLERTERDLDAQQLALRLVLPGDNEPLTARTEALGEWCQGFLLGFALTGFHDVSVLSGEAQEFLRDVREIARVDADAASEGSEEDESAFAEVVEYLRVGLMVVYEETRASSDMSPSSETRH